MDLHAEQAFEPPSFRIVVKDFDGRMPVNSMEMMIAAHYDLVFVPLSGGKMFDLPHRTDNPFFVVRINHNARARLREDAARSEEHTSELQSLRHLVCRLLLEKKKKEKIT